MSMRIPSHMTHQFSTVPRAEIPRSQFNRSFGVKTTFDAGYLVPVFVDEALPGDTFVVNMSALARLATPIKPIMDNMFLDSFFFAVPMRLVWNNFQKFMGEQDNPGDSTDFTIPQAVPPAGGYQVGSLADYLGLPTGIDGGSWGHSCLPGRAYYLIWNQWFRDENLQNSRNGLGQSGGVVAIGDGPDNWSATIPLMRRGKRHDYFTSCLPWPQKGDAVSVPIGGVAPVVPTSALSPTFQMPDSPGSAASFGIANTGGANVAYQAQRSPVFPASTLVAQWLDPALEADLSSANVLVTVNAMRQAFQIQKLLERDARSGTRYTEKIRAHFGVVSPDARLQRPEYLGGGSTPINISPVVQTSASGTYAETPQGNLGAIGTASIGGHGFAKSFTEHCIVLGFVSVRADLTYQQGLERMWSRETQYDFYWPALAHIGEQAVLNKEIYCQQDYNANNAVFGYQERYAEYRYKPSIITGKFRSTYATSLDVWHLAQEFSALPTLSETFIQENPPLDRVVAVPEEPKFLFDAYFQFKAARPMPVYGVPGMIDHF